MGRIVKRRGKTNLSGFTVDIKFLVIPKCLCMIEKDDSEMIQRKDESKYIKQKLLKDEREIFYFLRM
jgi:hypothetical protein